VIGHPYFEQAEPMVFTEESSHVTSDVALTARTTHQWNHGFGEIVGAVVEAGLVVVGLEEHRSVPWEALPGRMERVGDEFRLAEHAERVPLTYTLQAVRPSSA